MQSITRIALFALCVIFCANFLSYCDRLLVSGLEEELTRDFKLNDRQFGEFWTMFTLGYMVFAPVVGYLAARGSSWFSTKRASLA